ncbi:hypothetical protein [Pseudoalteromonas luteoviolacea]|uniref:Uncharacterized protein n=1 Tax=Pseudoalteromonas luteoviolacea S4054 TaxID=1129367 RepID=A0A0F6A4Y7_9GAMM|nr:hypothetical protein [Pseudoalteromonas luteoviolacea]AOT09498.1 hypothetical protein S4054249_17335 [Pseudoalteromonas luteoviolacea]AOT14410.1 hypothetical protein S40542_17305 [Pseudoalteromonas luteoviolacea]AOT19326.1 hypothetical protein S4054_17310 [Pseudoalteromonas luteoviolacea]KKE80926.1 hypothetical protein N479_24215 [Pseudoalteromonas luteoviolacea S4054]KZN65298.1 hypothetical protein N481_02565 [Pseudoalteromonas luteoviolacea S4047-1]
MSKLDKTEVLSAFEAAYEAVNGKKPEITIKPGWYSIDGGKNMRLADVAALTEELTSGSAGASEEKPVQKPVAKKAAKKPAPAAKAKAAAFTVVKANEEGFKAEEAWIVELAEKDHDCRLPRGVV